MKTLLALATGLAAIGIAATPASAEEHQIRMLTRGSEGQPMVFEPTYLEIAPGDTVTFVATDPTHNAQSIPGMLPDGAEGFAGRVNQEISVTLTQEGVYGVKCLPHYGMGMVALIKVGGDEPANLAEASAVRHPGRARLAFAELLAEAAE